MILIIGGFVISQLFGAKLQLYFYLSILLQEIYQLFVCIYFPISTKNVNFAPFLNS